MYLNHYWHGLRFMRALIILNISDVLVYLRIITTSSAIRLTQLGSIFFTVVSIEHFLEGSALLRQWYVPLSVPSSLSIFAPKYLREYKDTYFFLQNKYICIDEDSFGAKILMIASKVLAVQQYWNTFRFSKSSYLCPPWHQ